MTATKMTASTAQMCEGQRLRNALEGLTAESALIDVYGAMRRVDLIARAWLDQHTWTSIPEGLSIDQSLYGDLGVTIRHLQGIIERFEADACPVATCLVLRSVAGYWASEIRPKVRIQRES